MKRAKGRHNWLSVFYGALIAVIGLALAVPGVKLITLGGSPYYLIAGLATLVSGVLLIRHDPRGGWLYGLMLLGTAIWSFYEVGFDGWALVPRLVAPIVLGLPLLAMGLGRLTSRMPLVVPAVVAIAMAVAGTAAILKGAVEASDSPQAAAAPSPSPAGDDWPHYGYTEGGTRHSPLTEITPQNVSRLKLAWSTYIDQPMNGLFEARFEGTPLKVGDLVYACTGLNDIVALDARTGTMRWRFDAHTNAIGAANGNCRGPAYYAVPTATGPCAHRLYTATVDARLLAIDAETGKACGDFGDNGQVDLTRRMGQVYRGYYYVTSAPQVVRGKLVVGGFVADGQSIGEPSGVIRAFDAVTGRLAWAWDMGSPDFHGEPAEGQTYTLGTPNSWAPMSADEALGLVYVPTGNATPDYFGAHRSPAMEKYSTSLVAIDTETGILRWSFQAVHHDVWDYDVSVQPTLVELPTKDGPVPAVIQATKHGEVFVLDRRDGKPIFPVTERPVPQSPVPGEFLSPTQPHSSFASFIGRHLTERDMWGATPLDQLWCRIKFREARYDGPFTPLGLKPTIIQPGFSGGTEWGSVTYDPGRKLLVLIANDIVNYDWLVPRQQVDAAGLFPAKDPRTIDWSFVPQAGTPYGAHTVPFLSPTGSPCQRPPFSRLNAVDVTTGTVVWTQPLGTAKSIGPYGTQSHLPITIGTPTFGGAISTASGLTFVAASLDHTIRAFDTATGKLLWEGDLPADGLATPMTYSTSDGHQFLVIGVGDAPGGMRAAASEGTPAARAGGTIVAFALPSP